MQSIKCLILLVSGIIVDEEVEEEVEGSSKDKMENRESNNDSDSVSEEEEERRWSLQWRWTDRALMLQSGLLTAVEVEEYKDGHFIQRIRAR